MMGTDRSHSQPETDLEMKFGLVSGGGARIHTDDPDAGLLFCQN